ncbi:hypothetical protein H9P43_003444 [Blastocladiella emersonii ATCC 22665]|nr:hypothetical protein H9P43_003444 [Blastocladiella emersonii ATCC 22665]
MSTSCNTHGRLSVTPRPTLVALPSDVLKELQRYFDSPRDLARLRQSCRTLAATLSMDQFLDLHFQWYAQRDPEVLSGDGDGADEKPITHAQLRAFVDNPAWHPTNCLFWGIRAAAARGWADLVARLLADQRQFDDPVDGTEVAPDADFMDAYDMYVGDLSFMALGAALRSFQADPTPGRLRCFELLLAHPEINPAVRGNVAVVCVSEKGTIPLLRLLLAHPAVDPATHDNFPIGFAAQKGHPEAVRLLMADARVNPAAGDSYPLRAALEAGHTAIAEMLLADDRVDPTGTVALRHALSSADWPFFASLLRIRRFADQIVRPEWDHDLVQYPDGALRIALAQPGLDWSASPLLVKAVREQNVDAVRMILADGRFDAAARNNLALVEACKTGNREIVHLLLAAGPGQNTAAADLVPSLLEAAGTGAVDVVDTFLRDPRLALTAGGAEPAWMGQVLDAAVGAGQVPVLERLLAHRGADTRLSRPETLRLAPAAVTNGCADVVVWILDHGDGEALPEAAKLMLDAALVRGLDVIVEKILSWPHGTFTTVPSASAMALAMECNRAGAVAVLLERVSPMNLPLAAIRRSAFLHAIERGRDALLAPFVQHAPEFMASLGPDALKTAVAHGRQSIVRLLLDTPAATPDMPHDEIQLFASTAIARNHRGVLQLLLSHDAVASATTATLSSPNCVWLRNAITLRRNHIFLDCLLPHPSTIPRVADAQAAVDTNHASILWALVKHPRFDATGLESARLLEQCITSGGGRARLLKPLLSVASPLRHGDWAGFLELVALAIGAQDVGAVEVLAGHVLRVRATGELALTPALEVSAAAWSAAGAQVRAAVQAAWSGDRLRVVS